jgi:P27 family predicted phage terminase small subunit
MRRRPRQVKARPSAPACPTWLDREAKAEWRRIVPPLDKLGLLSGVDRGVLTAYVTTWSEWVEAAKQLRGAELVLDSADLRDGPKANPLLRQYRQLVTQLLALAQQLGLTPTSRLRMNAPTPDPDDDGSHLLS